MTGANCIDIVLLHCFDVLAHERFGYDFARGITMVMPVNTADKNGLAIDQQFSVFNDQVAEAYFQ